MSPPTVLQTVDQNGNLILVHPNGQISHENVTSSSSAAPTSNLPMMGIHNLNMEPASETTKTEAPVAFVKMEQLDASSSSALSTVPAEPSFAGSVSSVSVSPPPSSHSKPPKKRRSWGQELPEPTTNLPPRKRAKTDAEKEQRRIERVKRNRQAAHNSRERKRQEHEALEDENRELAAQKKALEEELARARRQIAELTGNKTACSPVIGQTQVQEAVSVQHLFMKSPFQSPVMQAESLFTAEQLPLMGTLTKVSSSFSSQPSTTTTPVLSNSSDFTSPATEPLPFTPTIDPLSLGQTRQLARLSRQDDLQCHPLASASMKSSTLAVVLSAISIFSGLVRLVDSSPTCGHLPSLLILALAFINHLLSSVASILTHVSPMPMMASWASSSNLASSPTRALDPHSAERQLQGRTMPLSKRNSSNGVFTGVLRGLCSGSTSVGWG